VAVVGEEKNKIVVGDTNTAPFTVGGKSGVTFAFCQLEQQLQRSAQALTALTHQLPGKALSNGNAPAKPAIFHIQEHQRLHVIHSTLPSPRISP
jgi:hypothetical protein